ncbi:MAG: MaoC/PaaZ C-terminal domain-containing protein [Chloroflexota bacterium]
MVFPGKAYDEIDIDQTFGDALTVTETHIVVAAGLFGDFNPLHVNQQVAEKSLFGSRILHGPFTSALVASPVGMFFAGTAIGYLEHNCRFKAPVRAGDTLTTTWTITDKLDKPKHHGGIAVMTAACHNQEGTLVAEAEGKILVSNRDSAAL